MTAVVGLIGLVALVAVAVHDRRVGASTLRERPWLVLTTYVVCVLGAGGAAFRVERPRTGTVDRVTALPWLLSSLGAKKLVYSSTSTAPPPDLPMAVLSSILVAGFALWVMRRRPTALALLSIAAAVTYRDGQTSLASWAAVALAVIAVASLLFGRGSRVRIPATHAAATSALLIWVGPAAKAAVPGAVILPYAALATLVVVAALAILSPVRGDDLAASGYGPVTSSPPSVAGSAGGSAWLTSASLIAAAVSLGALGAHLIGVRVGAGYGVAAGFLFATATSVFILRVCLKMLGILGPIAAAAGAAGAGGSGGSFYEDAAREGDQRRAAATEADRQYRFNQARREANAAPRGSREERYWLGQKGRYRN